MLKSWSRQAPTVLVGLLLIGALFVNSAAFADHEPANKVAAAGSTMEIIKPTDGAVAVLQERVKISSPFDLILSLSSECSILTALRTGDDETAAGASDTASAKGQLQMFLEIDGNRVPVTATETTPPGPGEGTDTDLEGTHGADHEGKVVFCNREYQRTVTDTENIGTGGQDGLDTEEDFIRTRTANAFNWLALDVGFNYDEPLPGQANNVVDIVVYAEYERTPEQCAGVTPSEDFDGCAQAIVGRRTLIAEPTNASIHEWVQPTDPDGGN